MRRKEQKKQGEDQNSNPADCGVGCTALGDSGVMLRSAEVGASGQCCASVACNRAPCLATHTSRGVGRTREERAIKPGTSVATGLWRPGTMVAPGQPQSPGLCRQG
ncbi:hypothetical protein WMY93_029995 [Mugilogobius chulae]|uniref:Uncharacterized protein n=1 Tax=Mugilogobius chulae TaxID=88201 RepID=A0AAW0MY83_9GOBI